MQWEPCDTQFLAEVCRRLGCQQHNQERLAALAGLCKSCLCWAWNMTSGSATTGHPRESRELHCRMSRPVLGQLPVSVVRGRTLSKLWQKLATDFVATGVFFFWAPGLEQFEDSQLPLEIKNVCFWDQRAWVVSKFATQHARRHGPACRGADADRGATEEVSQDALGGRGGLNASSATSTTM